MKKIVVVSAMLLGALLAAGTSTAHAVGPTATACGAQGCTMIPPKVAVAVVIIQAVKTYKCKTRGIKITCKRR